MTTYLKIDYKISLLQFLQKYLRVEKRLKTFLVDIDKVKVII